MDFEVSTITGFWGVKHANGVAIKATAMTRPMSSPSDWDDDEPRVGFIRNGRVIDMLSVPIRRPGLRR